MSKEWIIKKPDGTVKQINPFTGAEVWTVPGRGFKPQPNKSPENEGIEIRTQEDYCDFCDTKYLHTPPEKSRLVINGDSYEILSELIPEQIQHRQADFRRIGNLFEIVSHDYWIKNYHFHISPELNRWRERYLKSPGGMDHVLNILDYKLKLSGKSEKERKDMPLQQKLELAEAFFAGGHELIVARKHFTVKEGQEVRLCSSGELSGVEHFYYTIFTIETMKEILRHNRYVRYISVFQNWLKPAGASFDHLHKQLVAIDEWGENIEHEMKLLRQNPNIYNLYAANYAGYKNLVFAENDHAIAFADFGHRFPTLAIYSKSEAAGPMDMCMEEIRGMSDMVHACHAAMSNSIPCNEEWYYSPPDSIEVMPWHILIKWRINNPAGFEGGTKIHINTLDPEALKQTIVPRLFELRKQGLINNLFLGEECPSKPNALRYYKRYIRG